MTRKFLSAGKLEEYIRMELEELLDKAGIYHYDVYGWVDSDNADPDYIGHAMWQTQPAYNFNPFRNRASSVPAPTERQQELMISNADFEGLMNAARLSIGLFLFHSSLHKVNLSSDDSLYDLHRMSAVVYLSTASDRLRDFFVWAVFECSASAYGENGKFNGDPRKRFATPFLEATQLQGVIGADIQNSYHELGKVAPEIYKIKEARNVIVHEIATSLGRRERSALAATTRAADAGEDAEFLLTDLHQKSQNAEQIDDPRANLAKWFNLLMRASSVVFHIEHLRRKHLSH